MSAVALVQVGAVPPFGASTAVAADGGYRGPSFAATGVSAPTGQKPQSKLWFADGRWWATLFSKPLDSYSIWRLDGTSWTDTGVVVEPRNSARLDAMWDGSKLYVLTAEVAATATTPMQLRRYSYSTASGAYTLDGGFPTTVVTGGAEAAVMDKDTTGVIWVTYTRNNTVLVTHTAGTDATWVAPYVIPVPGATNLVAEDQSTVVSYRGRIGIMWSNQNDDAMYFASHADGDADSAWTPQTAIQQTEWADDHMNLKASADGRVFAVTKTSLNGPSDPLTVLSVLQLDGTWTHTTFGTVANNHTRPIVLLDEERQRVYVFASSPCCSGGVVYYKDAPMSQPTFAPGLGTPIISSALDPKINNVASTKQSVTSASGIVVLAGDDSTKFYLHNSIALADTSPPNTTITLTPGDPSGPDGARFEFTSTEAGSTFACRIDAAAYTACTSPTTYDGLSLGVHTFSVRATDASGNTDATPAEYSWTVETTSVASFAPTADAYVSQSTPSTNFGAATSITADGDVGAVRTGLLRFNLNNVTGAVAHATLRISISNGTVNGPKLYASTDPWTEAGVTWANQPATVGSPVVDLAAMPASTVDIDVTSAIVPGGTLDLKLVPDSTDGLVFSSREGSVSPTLTVTWDATGADVVPPETTVTAGPPTLTSSRSATLEFSANEPSTFECRLDGSAFTPCTSPQPLTGLADGGHQFDVRAIDAAGNVDASPATRTWTVDAVAPTVTGTTPAPGAVDVSTTAPVQATFSEAMAAGTLNTSTVRVSTSGGDPVAGTVTYDGASRTATFTPAQTMAPSSTYSVVVDGATDLAGNAVTPATFGFSTAAGSPVLTLTPTDDAHVVASRPNRADGAALALISDGGTQPTNAYLRFDASQLAGPVQSAVLRVFITNASVNGPEVARSAANWSESTVTWNTRPATVGGMVADVGRISAGVYVDYDVTAAVTGPGVVSFVLSSVSTDGTSFRSSEAASDPPQLVITTATP